MIVDPASESDAGMNPGHRKITPASARSCLVASIAFTLLTGSAQADLSISSKPTKNVACAAGVCTATAKGANLNATDLANMLAAGDTTVKTGGGALTIQVEAALSWTSANRLTLDANRSVGVRRPVVVAGTGALTIVTNDGGTGGDLLFFDKGKIDFWDLASSLIINGNSYTLVGDIKTLADAISANHSGSYALANDYDAAKDGTYERAPIKFKFRGTFEGIGHALDNLTISNVFPDPAGLFFDISGSLRDIRLVALKLRSGNGGGGLAWHNEGTVSHVSVEGTLGSRGRYERYTGAGGLIGMNDGIVEDSSASIKVEANTAGGLVGFNYGTILRCRTSGTVLGRNRAGGLAGRDDGLISQSFSTASVALKQKNRAQAGGLVGEMYFGEIDDSYATGLVQGQAQAYVGGLVGIGGIGRSQSVVSRAYSAGAVSAGAESIVGGFVGRKYRYSRFDTTYWDIDTSGSTVGCGLPHGLRLCSVGGLTDAQLKSALPAGFDPQIWGQSPSINNGYPYLLANPPQ
jgi:hypothetical protein